MAISTKKITSAGDVTAVPAEIKALTIVHTGTGGTLEVRDGSGTSDPVLISLATPAAAGTMHIEIPGGRMRFGTKVNVKTLTNISAVTFWF